MTGLTRLTGGEPAGNVFRVSFPEYEDFFDPVKKATFIASLDPHIFDLHIPTGDPG